MLIFLLSHTSQSHYLFPEYLSFCLDLPRGRLDTKPASDKVKENETEMALAEADAIGERHGETGKLLKQSKIPAFIPSRCDGAGFQTEIKRSR